MQAPIAPDTRPHYVFAALAFLLGVALGWQAVDLGVGGRGPDFGLPVFSFFAAVFLALGVWLLRHPVGVQSSITFTPQAIVFARWGGWRRRKCFAVPRQGIAAFWLVDGGLVRLFWVELTPEQALFMGLMRPNAPKGNAAAPFAKLVFESHGFGMPLDAILDAMRADLAQVGLRLGPENMGNTLSYGRRWPVLSVVNSAV